MLVYPIKNYVSEEISNILLSSVIKKQMFSHKSHITLQSSRVIWIVE